MTPFETITIDATVAACDGGGALGHPRVYLNLGSAGKAECPYCSRVFINRAATVGERQRMTGDAEPPSVAGPAHQA